MSVFIMSHKPTKYPKMKNYKLMQVGAVGKKHYCELSDDTSDNISFKNPYYCELTGLYWLWKNTKDEYVGIVHYRRYFLRSFSNHKFLTDDEIKRILTKYDVILPIHVYVKNTIREQFLENTGTKLDLLTLEKVLGEKYPEYVESYKEVFDGHVGYFRNMFVMKRKDYDAYCTWIFNILFEIEKRLDTSKYDEYHSRIYGFFSERLLYVYVYQNCMKICEIGYVQTDLKQNRIKDIAKRFQRMIVYGKEMRIL